MPNIITLYHGSTKIIEKPLLGKGNPFNDYGLGFYCTKNLELAKEWACADRSGGFANAYVIDIADLTLLDLAAPGYGLLDWLAVLLANRVFDITSPLAAEAKEYLISHFSPNPAAFDIISGYRADDSYFTFALDFLSSTISLRQLSRAMTLGSLGIQLTIKSQRAFDLLQFIGSEPADGEIYFTKRRERDKEARERYFRRERGSARRGDDVFILDILREEMIPGDARLQ